MQFGNKRGSGPELFFYVFVHTHETQKKDHPPPTHPPRLGLCGSIFAQQEEEDFRHTRQKRKSRIPRNYSKLCREPCFRRRKKESSHGCIPNHPMMRTELTLNRFRGSDLYRGAPRSHVFLLPKSCV